MFSLNPTFAGHVCALLLAACGGAPVEPAVEPAEVAAELPSESIYHLDVAMVDQRGLPVGLDVHRGHPAIVSMFYASCPMACPMLIEDIRAFEAQVEDPGELRVLLVSLDPANDTPEALAEVVGRHGVDGSRWTLARPRPGDVRAISAVLGITWRDDGAGGMNHASILTLVDREGRPQAAVDGLRRDPAPLLAALREIR